MATTLKCFSLDIIETMKNNTLHRAQVREALYQWSAKKNHPGIIITRIFSYYTAAYTMSYPVCFPFFARGYITTGVFVEKIFQIGQS